MSKPPYAVTLYWPSLEEVHEHQEDGLRPVVLWLPESGSARFVSEARRQLTDLMQEESGESQLDEWMDSHANELLGDLDAQGSR